MNSHQSQIVDLFGMIIAISTAQDPFIFIADNTAAIHSFWVDIQQL
jgi:hypothetical protein